jgi:hypothetical protein
MASTVTVESVLQGATKEDLSVIRDLLTDDDIIRFGQYLNTDVLWNSDAFVDKLGFATKVNAIRNARTKDLIVYDISLKEAVGLTELDGRPIVNPVPASTVVPPSSRTRVRFMGTWDVLEWISGATTDRAAAVRRALWWLFFVSDKEQLKRKLDEAEREVGDVIYFVCVYNVCIT